MNNLGILKKVAEELSKESPKLDYVRGMIDTLIEMQDAEGYSYRFNTGVVKPDGAFVPDNVTLPKDEGSIIDAQAKAALAKTMELANKSLET